MSTRERPVEANDEHFRFLDELRESGETNMFGARPYLMAEFPSLGGAVALRILDYWMHTPKESR